MADRTARFRSYELDERALRALTEQYRETSEIPNPYAKGCYCYYFVEVLKALGANGTHTFNAVRRSLETLMSDSQTRRADGKTDWDRFVYKVGTALPCEGRIVLNAEALQRLREYGLKLLQVGQEILHTNGIVIDIFRGAHGTLLYRLNTDSDEPINEFRSRRRK